MWDSAEGEMLKKCSELGAQILLVFSKHITQGQRNQNAPQGPEEGLILMRCVFCYEFPFCSTCWECHWTGGNNDHTQNESHFCAVSRSFSTAQAGIAIQISEMKQWWTGRWLAMARGFAAEQRFNPAVPNPGPGQDHHPPVEFLPRGLLATPRHCTRNSNQGCASCSSFLPRIGQFEGVKLEINQQQSENPGLEITGVTQH